MKMLKIEKWMLKKRNCIFPYYIHLACGFLVFLWVFSPFVIGRYIVFEFVGTLALLLTLVEIFRKEIYLMVLTILGIGGMALLAIGYPSVKYTVVGTFLVILYGFWLLRYFSLKKNEDIEPVGGANGLPLAR